MSEKPTRYAIDERSGIIAVVDRTLADPDDPGLDPDRPWVVWYEDGEPVTEKCHLCGHERGLGWRLKNGASFRAQQVCDRLNRKKGAGR